MKLADTFLIISICFLFIGQELQAQTTKKLHQSFMLDGIKDITIDVSYPYHVETWAGNTVLVETSVQLENAPPAIIRMFEQSGRYQIIESVQAASIKYALKPIPRKPVLTSKGECTETIKIRFLVPADVVVKKAGNPIEDNDL